MSVKIFVCTHKKFDPPKNPIYIPLHVGRKGKEDLGYLGDHTGIEISEKNPYYSELTGLYWVANNCHDADIKGSCHYRRLLINENGKAYTEPEIERILSQYDLMTTKTLTLRSSYYDGFSADHNQKDLDLAGEVLKQKYPEYYDTFQYLVHRNETYFGNMIICKAELFDAYIAWLFSIFFEMEPKMDFTGYDDYRKRVYGFISEFLLKVYCEVNHFKVHESMVGMVGEKKETIEVRARLSEYIMKKELSQAKEYFYQISEKRPDILMEASDVNGELKLAMQIISTCEHEYELYGSSILDQICDYQELKRYFEIINRMTVLKQLNMLSEDDKMWLQNHEVSDVSWQISKLLFYS